MHLVGFIIRKYSTVSRLWAGQVGLLIPAEARYFFFFKMSRLAVAPIQPSKQWVLVFFHGSKAAGV